MPLYDYKCENCGNVREAMRPYVGRHNPMWCDLNGCDGAMTMVWLPAQVMRDIGEYTSPIDGTRITTRSAHRDHMKRHGVIEMGNERPAPRKGVSIPTESIRREMHMQVQRMKSEGKL